MVCVIGIKSMKTYKYKHRVGLDNDQKSKEKSYKGKDINFKDGRNP